MNMVTSNAVSRSIKGYNKPFSNATISGTTFSFAATNQGLYYVSIGGNGGNTGYALIATVKQYGINNCYVVKAETVSSATVSSVSWNGSTITVTMSFAAFYSPVVKYIN